MTFEEYRESLGPQKDSYSFRYSPAFCWVHPEILPVRLVSLGETEDSVVIIPDNVRNRWGREVPVVSIAKEVFAGNEKVTDVVLPVSLSGLPEGCFAGCRNLKNIIIPRTVKRIPEGVFSGCEALTNIYYEGTLDEWKEMEIVHQKHEIEFGELIPGTPVQSVKAEHIIHIPGNEAIFSANIHLRCNLNNKTGKNFCIYMKGKDVTDTFIVK